MLCPLGNPFFLFIITDHLKRRSFVVKAPENFFPRHLGIVYAVFKCDETNNPKIECRERGLDFCCFGSSKTYHFNYAITFTP